MGGVAETRKKGGNDWEEKLLKGLIVAQGRVLVDNRLKKVNSMTEEEDQRKFGHRNRRSSNMRGEKPVHKKTANRGGHGKRKSFRPPQNCVKINIRLLLERGRGQR